MRFTSSSVRAAITVRNFTIAMVAVNAVGLYAVHNKLQQAQVPNAYALDQAATPTAVTPAFALPQNTVRAPKVVSEVQVASLPEAPLATWEPPAVVPAYRAPRIKVGRASRIQAGPPPGLFSAAFATSERPDGPVSNEPTEVLDPRAGAEAAFAPGGAAPMPLAPVEEAPALVASQPAPASLTGSELPPVAPEPTEAPTAAPADA